MARESHYQRQGMAKWIEESRNADPKKKAAVLGNEMSLTAMRNGLIIDVWNLRFRNAFFGVLFLVLWRAYMQKTPDLFRWGA